MQRHIADRPIRPATAPRPIARYVQHFDHLASGQIPLGMLSDMISFTLDLPLDAKLRLLDEANVDERAAYLLRLLGRMPGVREPTFPPEFSLN